LVRLVEPTDVVHDALHDGDNDVDVVSEVGSQGEEGS
jgi:hypothetical protein